MRARGWDVYDTEQYRQDEAKLGTRVARELAHEEYLPELTICSALRAAGYGLAGPYRIIPNWRQA